MNASEYVAKALEDKGYLQDVVGHMPNDVVAKIQNEDSGMGQMSANQIMSYILSSAAPSMDIEAPAQQIEDECKRQCPTAKFASIRMLLRVGRMITKEARKRGL